MKSLRSRALIGGSVWAAMIVMIGGFSLFNYFSNATQRRFDQALMGQHLQIVVALNNSGGDPEIITTYLSNPNFERPYSGSYWQAAGPDDVYLTSRSLFDAFLEDPVNPGPEPQIWQGEGPAENLRGIHQLVELADGTEWVVTVGESVAGLIAEQQRIRQSLLSTLGLIGVLGVAAAVLLTSVTIRPLSQLRDDVARRWDEGGAMAADSYPEEVAPLVADINTLLSRNREIVDRARRQAADMAHALKTPSAILRNELEILAMEGVNVELAQDALARIDAQLMRSLARIRAANSGAGLAERVDLTRSVERLTRVFRSMHESDGRNLETRVPKELKVPMDVQDLEEILGNMLENAFKYCDRKVIVTAGKHDEYAVFTIEDDGPGIPYEGREEALRAGGRLDTSKPGTGLGMAIAQDLLQAYGGQLDLDESNELGGLKVICSVPLSPIGQSLTRAAA